MFWIPALGGAGLCLSIVSYAGQIWFGASTDLGLVPDPEELTAGFYAEFETLQRFVQAEGQDRSKAAAGRDLVGTMNEMLDEAMAKVDALLEEK